MKSVPYKNYSLFFGALLIVAPIYAHAEDMSGVWAWSTPNRSAYSELHITKDSRGYRFNIDANNGANMGDQSGRLKPLKNNQYFFKAEDCELTFQFKPSHSAPMINLDQKGDCESGMGVWLGGTYEPKKKVERRLKLHPATLSSMEILIPQQDQQIRQLVGDNRYQTLVQNTGRTNIEESKTSTPPSHTIDAWVNGLAVSNRYIIQLEGPYIWMAMTEFSSDEYVVLYYTNATNYVKELHPVIKEWYDYDPSKPKIEWMSVKNQ